MLVRIGNTKNPDQTASSEASLGWVFAVYLGLFYQVTSFQNFRIK